MIAIGTQDVDALIDIVVEMTTPPADLDIAQLRANIETWLNRYLLVGVGQLDMSGIMSSGMALLHDNRLMLPADLALLFRVLLRLQGLGRGVGTEVRVTELLAALRREDAGERFEPARIARGVGRSVAKLGAPSRERSRRPPSDPSSRSVRARSASTSRSTTPTTPIDRLVDGLVTAASVMAGAQLISRRAGPTIGSFSLPGLVAAGVGVVTWRHLVAQRSAQRTWVSRARGHDRVRGA